ncbi:MAG: hypothetical protein IH940_09615 [Acidobacteria bacterium]|nr:hypothetical protein [Acidobacteriota bacterium]
MSHVGYIVAAWALTLGVLALYSVTILRRGRKLSSEVPPARRRWMSTDNADHV